MNRSDSRFLNRSRLTTLVLVTGGLLGLWQAAPRTKETRCRAGRLRSPPAVAVGPAKRVKVPAARPTTVARRTAQAARTAAPPAVLPRRPKVVKAAKLGQDRFSPACPSDDRRRLPQCAFSGDHDQVPLRQHEAWRARLAPGVAALSPACGAIAHGCPRALLSSRCLAATVSRFDDPPCFPKSPTVYGCLQQRVRLPFSTWNSTVLKSIRSFSLTALAMFSWSLPVLAQSAPPPAASDSDDLEVPANPATVPGAAADKPLPAVAPDSKSNGAARQRSNPRRRAMMASCSRTHRAARSFGSGRAPLAPRR